MMMTPRTLNHLAAIQSRKAAELRHPPVMIFSEETALEDAGRALWLGEYVHPRWQKARNTDYKEALEPWHYAALSMADDWLWLFIDNSGWGEDGEAALSLDQLEVLLRDLVERADGRTLGVGIVDEGEFQCHLGLYRRK